MVAHNDRKWMMFVDGENVVMRLQMMWRDNKGPSPKLEEGPYYRPDIFVWPRERSATSFPSVMTPDLVHSAALRAYYYTRACGDEPLVAGVRDALRDIGFDANVFKKLKRSEKAKGVDVALTKDMLCHAFRDNYDVAVLVAGDGDYVPLVEEVKRLGKIVCVNFFKHNGMSPDLKRASDIFYDITEWFAKSWVPVG